MNGRIMTPERWQQVRDVLHEAMQLKPEERHAYLDHWRADDDDLCQQISELLEAEQGLATDFLESLPQAEAALDRLTVLASKSDKIYAPLNAGLLHPYPGDRTITDDRLHQLDKLYQSVAAALDYATLAGRFRHDTTCRRCLAGCVGSCSSLLPSAAPTLL